MDGSKWYLKKASDGSLFGPVPFSQLIQWSVTAQISPLDRVSSDQKTWLKAPMVPELEMDYLIEVGPDQYYGPTSVGAVREFLEEGEITAETIITNCTNAAQLKVRDIVPPTEVTSLPGNEGRSVHRSSIRVNLQQRIRELEVALMEERRASETAKILLEKLEAKLAELSKKK